MIQYLRLFGTLIRTSSLVLVLQTRWECRNFEHNIIALLISMLLVLLRSWNRGGSWSRHWPGSGGSMETVGGRDPWRAVNIHTGTGSSWRTMVMVTHICRLHYRWRRRCPRCFRRSGRRELVVQYARFSIYNLSYIKLQAQVVFPPSYSQTPADACTRPPG